MEEWTSALYVFLILFAVLLYLLCAIIMPSDFPDDGDFRQYFFSHRKWFFGIFLAFFSLDLVDSFIKDHDLLYVPILLIWFVIFGIGMVTKNAKYHGIFAVVVVLGRLSLFLSGMWDQVLTN